VGIRWRPWSESTLREAQDRGAPVLLVVTARWNADSARLENRSLADPGVAAVVDRHYVPVRVDVDRRPDLAARYLLGGLPTVAFLTPRGALVAAGGSMPPDRLHGILQRMAAVFEREPDSVERAAAEHRRRRLAARPRTGDVDDLGDHVVAAALAAARQAFDPEGGGFGGSPRMPHPFVLHLLAERVHWAQDRDAAVLLGRALHAMTEGALWDAADGGFFRCSAGRTWERPCTEKLPDVNAELLRVCLAAWRACRDGAFRMVAEECLAALHRLLAVPEGGFRAARAADDAYYALAPHDRAGREPPAADDTILVDRSAEAALAYLAAAGPFGGEWRRFALLTLDRLWEEGFRPGWGMGHVLPAGGAPEDEGERPSDAWLPDQVWTLLASAEAYQQTGEAQHLERARLLGDLLCRRFLDPETGAFRDLAAGEPAPAGEPPLEPLYPLEDNGLAAEALLTLGHLAGERRYREAAGSALASLHELAAQAGLWAAAYARAVDRWLREPLRVRVRARPGDGAVEDLLHPLLTRYHPWRIITWETPPPEEEPSLELARGGRAAPAARTPQDVEAALAALSSGHP
jgi:uncharacterized protein YyaL (SSP411 family)